MLRAHFYLLLCLSLLFPCLTQAQVQLTQYNGRTIGDIEIVLQRSSQDSSFDPNGIRSRLKTKVGEPFSQLDFDEDLKMLSTEYDRVEPLLDVHDGKVNVRLTLWPKPTISEIRWEGNQSIPTKKLEKELGIARGEIFERGAFATAFQKVKVLYIKKGFFESELGYRVETDPTTGDVTIDIRILEGRRGHIRAVQFEGFSRDEQLELLDMIATKKYSFMISWATGYGSYQQEAVEQDRFIVLNFLHDKGYADAHVEVKVHEVPDLDGIVVEFIADRGPLYRFGSVSFEGQTLFTDEELIRQLQFETGQPFSPEKLRNSVKAITDLYGARGYIETIVNYEQHRVLGEPIYDVDFIIQEGEQYRVGLVRIIGNTRTQQRVILRESRIQPGQVFDSRRIEQTESILQNMGYFDSCNIYAVRPRKALVRDEIRDGPLFRDVYVEVCETATGSFALNLGGSTQDGMFTGIELSERNFDIAGVPYIFRRGPSALRGAGEYARINTNIGKKQIQVIGSWTKPFVYDSRWTVGLEIERSMNRRPSKDYELEKFRVGARAIYPLNAFLRIQYNYRLAYLFTDLRRPADELPVLLANEAKNNGTVSAAGVSLSYSTLNPRLMRGLESVLNAEYAGLLGDFDFLKFAYINTYYFPVPHLGTGKFRLELRTLQPIWEQRISGIPIGERFMLGGETTIRGYIPYSVGPQASNRDPLGGLSSVLFSAELNRRFMRAVDGFVFCDGGWVTLKPWQVATPRVSIGFGVRLSLMQQMPLTFGWGFPLNPKRKADVEHFYFSVGGRF